MYNSTEARVGAELGVRVEELFRGDANEMTEQTS